MDLKNWCIDLPANKRPNWMVVKQFGHFERLSRDQWGSYIWTFCNCHPPITCNNTWKTAKGECRASLKTAYCNYWYVCYALMNWKEEEENSKVVGSLDLLQMWLGLESTIIWEVVDMHLEWDTSISTSPLKKHHGTCLPVATRLSRIITNSNNICLNLYIFFLKNDKFAWKS